MVNTVRGQIQPFLEHIRKETGGQLPPGIELLKGFIEHMAKRNVSFRNIHPDAIKTRWVGMYHIYDMVRKQAGKY